MFAVSRLWHKGPAANYTEAAFCFKTIIRDRDNTGLADTESREEGRVRLLEPDTYLQRIQRLYAADLLGSTLAEGLTPLDHL